MTKSTSNILALFHDGLYVAEITGGGICVGRQQGRRVDFAKLSPEARRLSRLHETGTMNQLRKEASSLMSKNHRTQIDGQNLKDGDKDWNTSCQVCDQSPTVHPTDLCGPCCFGDAETAGGNW